MTGFRTVAQNEPWGIRAATVVRGIMEGKINSSGEVTLDVSQPQTKVLNPYASTTSIPLLVPLTAAAAAEIASVYVSGRQDGEFLIMHPNNATPGRTWGYVVIA